jgi:enoyl-CoA hydratase/carnithine racemase
MTRNLIDIAHHGEVAVVTLQHPPANAMSLALTEEIAAVFERLGRDSALRSLVLSGQGNCFCAGLDLKALPKLDVADQRRLLNALNRAFLAVYSCPLPVVGAINGHAIAGGLVLALCCDWRVAARTPFLAGLTEVRVGVPFPVGAIEVVRQELSPRVARELVLFGRNMTSDAAVEAGVFDETVDADALLDRALAKAIEFAALPPSGFAKIKRGLRSGSLEAIEAAMAGADPSLNGWLSEETIQAAAAVLRKT